MQKDVRRTNLSLSAEATPKLFGCVKYHAKRVAWSFNMVKISVGRYCELANKKVEQLYSVSTPCLADHQFLKKKEELEMVGELSKASYLWDKILQVTLKRSAEYEILSSVNLGRRKYELRMWFWSANFGNRELGMVQMTLEICLSETHASVNRDAQTKDLSSQAMLIPDVKATMEKGWEEVIKKAHTKTKGKESPLCCIDRHPPHLKVQEHTRECSQEQSISSLDISTSTSRWMFARAMSSVEIMKFKWVQSLTQWVTVLTNEMLREWIRNHPPVQVPSLSIF